MVNEQAPLPVLMPLAPAATAPSRIGAEIAATMTAHHASAAIVDAELGQMNECRFAPTANRSVVGIMNEFTFLADVYRRDDPDFDLLHMAMKLASTPCSPLYRRNGSPGPPRPGRGPFFSGLVVAGSPGRGRTSPA